MTSRRFCADTPSAADKQSFVDKVASSLTSLYGRLQGKAGEVTGVKPGAAWIEALEAGSNNGLTPKSHSNDTGVSTDRKRCANEGPALATASNCLSGQQTGMPSAERAPVMKAALAPKRFTPAPAKKPWPAPANNKSDSAEQPSQPEPLLMVQRLPAVPFRSLPSAESL